MTIENSGIRCLKCEYNLTGLTTDICPECGIAIDWRAIGDPELRRAGTPVYQASGWKRVPATLHTLLMMLFTPWTFANRLRNDEPIAPALSVASIGLLPTLFWKLTPEWNPTLDFFRLLFPAIVIVIALQCFFLSILSFHPSKNAWPWPRRLRFWVLVSCYSTCFVASWPAIGLPPLMVQWNLATFYWPLNSREHLMGPRMLPVSVIFYWWVSIVLVVFLARHRPRWLAVLVVPILVILTYIAGRFSFISYLSSGRGP